MIGDITTGPQLATQLRALADAVEQAGDFGGLPLWVTIDVQPLGGDNDQRTAAVDEVAGLFGLATATRTLRSGSVHHGTDLSATCPDAPGARVAVYTQIAQTAREVA